MKYRLEVTVKQDGIEKTQSGIIGDLDAIDELFEKLQKFFELYRAELKSIKFEKGE